MFVLAFAESIQLFPDGSLFIHIGIILLMIWVLNRTFFRPINKVIEQREKHQGSKGGEAAGILRDADAKEAKVAGELLDARTAGYEIVEKEQKKASDAHDKKLSEVKAETDGLFDTGRTEIEKQAAETRDAIVVDAHKLADKIAASILKA